MGMTYGEIATERALRSSLYDIVDQLKTANALKALELKLKFHANVTPTPEWAKPLDKLIEQLNEDSE